MIPIFSFNGDIWRKVNPRFYFTKNSDGTYDLKHKAIYDVVLTQSLSLKEAKSIQGVSHPSCISGKCQSLNSVKANKIMVEIAEREFNRILKKNGIIKQMLQRFPDLNCKTIEVNFEE